MAVTVNITRVTNLYGESVKELWTLVFDQQDGDLEVRLKCLPSEGSTAKYVRKDVPPADVPEPVLKRAEDEVREMATDLGVRRWG